MNDESTDPDPDTNRYTRVGVLILRWSEELAGGLKTDEEASVPIQLHRG